MSQILMERSWLPLAMQVPSGWNLTELTPVSWSQNVLMILREEKSHSFTVRSSDPEAIRRVSGENWQVLIQLLWALIEKRNLLSLV